jgi:hypothetical protein
VKTWAEQERRAVVAGWASTTLGQEAYARSKGISPRTLRLWVERYGSGPRPIARAKAIIERAIEELHALQRALDAEDALRAAEGDDAVDDAMPDRHGEPAERHAPGPLPDVHTEVLPALPRAAPVVDIDAMLQAVRAEVASHVAPSPPGQRAEEAEPIVPKPMPRLGSCWW